MTAYNHPYLRLARQLIIGKKPLHADSIESLMSDDTALAQHAASVPVNLANPAEELRHILQVLLSERRAIASARAEKRKALRTQAQRIAICDWRIKLYREKSSRYPESSFVLQAASRKEAAAKAQRDPRAQGYDVRIIRDGRQTGRRSTPQPPRAATLSELWEFNRYSSWDEWLFDVVSFRGMTRQDLGRQYGGSYALPGKTMRPLFTLKLMSSLEYLLKVGAILEIPDAVLLGAARHFTKFGGGH